MDIERKIKKKWTIGLVIYSILVFFLSCVAFYFYLKYVDSSESAMIGFIMIVLLLLLPPILITILGWDIVYKFLNKEERQDNEIKIQQIVEERKRQSDELREKYNLDNDILTLFEYNQKYAKKEQPTKVNWILLCIFELLCLSLTIGSAFYYSLLSKELLITLIFIGIVFGIYGFCVLCKAYIKGIIFSFFPILCYVVPLVITYYILDIKIEWILGLTTILIGTLLFAIFIYITVIIPKKIKDNAKVDYYNNLNISIEFEENIIETKSYVFFKNSIILTVSEYNNGLCLIIFYGDKVYNNILINNVLIDLIKYDGNIEDAVVEGIKLLKLI